MCYQAANGHRAPLEITSINNESVMPMVDLPIRRRCCWKPMSNRATIIGKCRAKTGLLRRLKYVPSFLAINFGDQLAFLSFPAARVRALSARNSIKALARAIIASFRPSSAPVALSRHRSNIESDGEEERERDTEGKPWWE